MYIICIKTIYAMKVHGMLNNSFLFESTVFNKYRFYVYFDIKKNSQSRLKHLTLTLSILNFLA